MTDRTASILKLVLRLAVTTALLAWVFHKIDLAGLGQTIRQAQWVYLWPMWGLAIGSYLLLSWKMAMILRRQDCATPVLALFAISAVTTLYGMVLPGCLDISAKWYLLKQQTGKGTNVLSSMVYNQFTTTLVVLVMGVAAILMVTPPQKTALRVLFLVLIVLLLVLGLLVLHRSIGPRLTRWLGHLLRPLPAVVREPGLKVLSQLALFQTAGWGLHAWSLGLSLAANTIVGTMIYALAAFAAGIHVPVPFLFWLCTAIFILGKLPISVAEFGVREATLVSGLAAYGVPGSAALVMSMLILTNRLLLAAIGAAVQIHWTYRRQRA
ncbi:MAG: flippase-like domain-containing protein [Phycisphaerae bacterium]|nr:flippase-like domain-containing protein [Phycisphaerae bacterium]